MSVRMHACHCRSSPAPRAGNSGVVRPAEVSADRHHYTACRGSRRRAWSVSRLHADDRPTSRRPAAARVSRQRR